jgi:hypothetical protein
MPVLHNFVILLLIRLNVSLERIGYRLKGHLILLKGLVILL